MIRFQSDERSKDAWSHCVLCIPFSLSGSPNKCWPHTCHALCLRATWRLGLGLRFNMKNKYIDLSFLTGWWKASTTSTHKEGWYITGWYRSHADKSVCWCITSHPRTPSASTLYTSYQYTWFPSISSYCCPSVAWEACGSWCKQSWWRQTGLCWSQPQDHLGLTV